jgi:hypothetical protein
MRRFEPEERSVHRCALDRQFTRNAGERRRQVPLRKEAGLSVGPRGGGMARALVGPTDAVTMNGADSKLSYGAYVSDDAE